MACSPSLPLRTPGNKKRMTGRRHFEKCSRQPLSCANGHQPVPKGGHAKQGERELKGFAAPSKMAEDKAAPCPDRRPTAVADKIMPAQIMLSMVKTSSIFV